MAFTESSWLSRRGLEISSRGDAYSRVFLVRRLIKSLVWAHSVGYVWGCDKQEPVWISEALKLPWWSVALTRERHLGFMMWQERTALQGSILLQECS